MRNLATLLLALAAACGDRTEEDLEKSPEQVRAAAADMDAGELKDVIAAYQEAIAAKEKEVEAFRAKYKDLSPQDLLSDSSKEMQAEARAIAAQINKLTERLRIYEAQLAKGR